MILNESKTDVQPRCDPQTTSPYVLSLLNEEKTWMMNYILNHFQCFPVLNKMKYTYNYDKTFSNCNEC